jgi:hypothetical protein
MAYWVAMKGSGIRDMHLLYCTRGGFISSPHGRGLSMAPI